MKSRWLSIQKGAWDSKPPARARLSGDDGVALLSCHPRASHHARALHRGVSSAHDYNLIHLGWVRAALATLTDTGASAGRATKQDGKAGMGPGEEAVGPAKLGARSRCFEAFRSQAGVTSSHVLSRSSHQVLALGLEKQRNVKHDQRSAPFSRLRTQPRTAAVTHHPPSCHTETRHRQCGGPTRARASCRKSPRCWETSGCTAASSFFMFASFAAPTTNFESVGRSIAPGAGGGAGTGVLGSHAGARARAGHRSRHTPKRATFAMVHQKLCDDAAGVRAPSTTASGKSSPTGPTAPPPLE